MRKTKLFNHYLCAVMMLLFTASCGSSNPAEETELSGVRLISPVYIASKVGATVELRIEVPENQGLSYSWTCDDVQFSTDKNPSLKLDKAGLLNIAVTVKGEGKASKTLKTAIFSAKKSEYKVVAYMPSWRTNYVLKDWDKITHLCFCFGEVKTDGSIDMTSIRRNILPLIKAAHERGVYALLSIGGGTGGEDFSAAILNETSRKNIAENVLKILAEHNFDGVDVDYEHWDYTPSNNNIKRSEALELLYRDLRAGMPENSQLTIATSLSYMRNKGYNESMTQYLDFVNMMIYDHTGPWAGSDVGSHSDWNYYINSIEKAKEFNIPNNKIVPGVPFYGVKFKSKTSSTGAEHIAYSDIVRQYPGAENANEVERSGAYIYYDGMPLVRQKSEYVVSQQLGGIMFWEITQDTDVVSKSLLQVIYDTLLKH